MDENKFNIILLGESHVGKTSLLEYLLGMEFRDNLEKTVGIDFIYRSFKFNKTEYNFKIYDTAGQERYRSVAGRLLKLGEGYMLVFDVTDDKSFEKIKYWLDSIKDIVNIKEKIIFLIGNKIDLNNRIISKEDAEQFAKDNNIKYFETSAKIKVGINDAFENLYIDLINLHSNKNNNSGNLIAGNNGKTLNEEKNKNKENNITGNNKEKAFQIQKNNINNQNVKKKKNWFLRHCLII